VAKSITIALDAMGGDRGAEVCVPAGITMLRQYPELHLILVGQPAAIEPHLASGTDVADRIQVVEATEVVTMDESAADALRKKKDSSLRVAINLVKKGEAQAIVSAGNTGALMATARFVLKTLPGIDRPAIMAVVPTMAASTFMLDLGANTDCTAEHLYQFAIMGAVVAAEVEKIPHPRVGLLNIGEEDIKGNDTIREAAAKLNDSPLNYIGFVEGNDVGQHKADVVVCDGFSGNVALKVMEGTARLIRHFLREEFGGSWYGKLAGAVSLPVLKKLADKLDPRKYNGAILVGLNGIVVKSHGGADEVAFQQAIYTAMIEVEQDVPAKIGKLLEGSAA